MYQSLFTHHTRCCKRNGRSFWCRFNSSFSFLREPNCYYGRSMVRFSLSIEAIRRFSWLITPSSDEEWSNHQESNPNQPDDRNGTSWDGWKITSGRETIGVVSESVGGAGWCVVPTDKGDSRLERMWSFDFLTASIHQPRFRNGLGIPLDSFLWAIGS